MQIIKYLSVPQIYKKTFMSFGNYNIKIVFILVFSFLVIQQVHASQDNPIITILDGSKNQIAKDSAVTSTDSLYFSTPFSSNLIKPYPIQNVITFHINEQSLIVLPSTFTAVVHLRIYYVDSSANSDSLNDVRLFINYSAAASYTARASFVFKGAYSVKIKILNDTISSSVIGALMIENQLSPSRSYTFSCTDKAIQSVSLAGSTSDELSVAWGNKIGVDQVDVEWAYIDSAALASNLYGTPGNLNPALIFFNNATRVSVSALSYNIPLIFSGAGSVFVRVRSVQLNGSKRMVSKWSSDYLPAGMLRYDFSGHERNLNWQSSVSFAEDGKRKVVVQYFDGSLRSRQTVTKDNTTNTTITAETFYDYQGRPTIQVLPSPSLNSIVKYTNAFNRVNGAEYDKSYFDSVISPNTACSLTAPAMDSAYGAAMYYSTNTPVNSGINRYIPEAYGYAFTQTEYTQDNTGRISRQSGVGQEFKLNSTHETKYSYAITPDQNELDALFGTEVGDHTHYFKNAVRDANGQYSISYVDMHGRTIATALAGDAPSGLSALSSNIPTTITQTLADANTNTTEGTSMVSHKSLFVEKSGSQHFVYSLSPQSFPLTDCKSQSICYDCLYDLNITITDDCGNTAFGGRPLVISRPNISIADTICNGSGIAVDTTFTLNAGNYEITKTLSINPASSLNYFNNVYSVHNTCKTESDFIIQQAAAIPHSNCNITCESCRAGIGSYTNFANNYLLNVYGESGTIANHQQEIDAAYQAAVASCDQYCNDAVSANNNYVREAMLLDMSPKSGQYANLDSAQDPYSVFYKQYVTSVPLYQQASGYKDANGILDSVVDNITQKKVPPQQLDANQFALDFKPSWANTLLVYHPEKCKLDAYENNHGSYNWDKKFQSINTYKDAINQGYDNPLASGPSKDSLASNSSFATSLSAKYTIYTTSTMNGTTVNVSMWQMAILQTKCPTGDSTCIQNIVFNSHDYTLPCTNDSNQAWRNFQQLYIAYKTELLNDYYYALTCTVNGSSITATDLLNDTHYRTHYLNFTTSASALATNGLGFTGSSTQQEIKDSATLKFNAYYISTCQSYKPLWSQQLSAGYSTTQINQLLPLLQDVCVAGSDVNHSFGSRDVSSNSSAIPEIIGSTTYWVRSFDDVINDFNTANSLSFSTTRTADVLTQPSSYNAAPVYTQTITTQPTTDECSQINYYNSLYQNNHLTSETFSQYLKRTQNTDISETDLQTLLGSCGTTTSCKYLEKPISLPPIFQAGVSNACTDCSAFNTLYSQYLNLYGATSTPIIANQDDTVQQKKNQLFTNYMNNHLGYNFGIIDYLNFQNQCKDYGSFSDSANSQYVQPISQSNANCYFTASQGLFNSNTGYAYYIHSFDTVSTSYPYNIPAENVYLSQNNNSSWTNSQGSWTMGNGFTGHALQLNSATPDTSSITLSYSTTSSTIQQLTDISFYNSTSDSGYTNYTVYINGELRSSGLLIKDNGLLHPILAHLNGSQSYVGVTQFIITLKLFGGLHGNSALFKIDNFIVHGFIQNDYNYSDASGDKPHPNIIYLGGPDPSKNQSYPYSTDYYMQSQFDSVRWTSSYNNFTIYTPPNQSLTPSMGISSASQDTAIITGTFYIKKGQLLDMRYFSWYAQTNPDSGYTHYSVCVNGRYIGQDSLGLNYFGQLFYDGGKYWKQTPGSRYPIEVYNTAENITNKITFTIKLFGGLHGVNSMFLFNHFAANGYLYQIPTTQVAQVYTLQNNNWGRFINNQPGVHVGDIDISGNQLTVEALFNRTEFYGCVDSACTIYTPQGDIVSKHNDGTDDNYLLRPNQASITTTTGFHLIDAGCLASTSKTYHVAMVYDGHYLKFYRNGFLIVQDTCTGNLITNNWATTIGSSAGPTATTYTPSDFHGYINEVKIWNTARTQSQLRQYMGVSLPSPSTQTGLLGYYIFDSLNNKQGNSLYDGTLFHATFIKQSNPQSSLTVDSCGQIKNSGLSGPTLCGRSQPAYPPTKLDSITSCTDSTLFAVSLGKELYKSYKDSLSNKFDSIYKAKCLQAYKYEKFTLTNTLNEYHYTLYYYDQAGDLVQTVPPKAVHPNWDSAFLAQVKNKRSIGDTLRPGHDFNLATQYRYNALDQLTNQISPESRSAFFYDRLGRLVLSKNKKQIMTSKYSYTTYDPLGRIIEVGELTNSAFMNNNVSRRPDLLQNFLTAADATRTQITHTTYDTVYYGAVPQMITAKNLRNRVAYVEYFNTAADQNNFKHTTATYYSYDIGGNVDTLVQDYTIKSLDSANNRFFKKIAYQYDLISGKVNSVAYNAGQPDAFYHRYTYDAENRITTVETSTDSIYWEKDAFYKYYNHGPLARTILGQLQVQGVDYAYTLQGWLKGINTSNAGTAYDMGNDGFTAPVSANQYVARDVYGFSLHYFGTDYKPIGNQVLPFAKVDNTVLADFKPLYNGNIAAIGNNQTSFSKPLLFSYSYDQLNRLIQMRTYRNSATTFATTNAWSPAAVNDYNEDISYDPNGNILKYKRFGNSTNAQLTNALLMDSLSYNYEPKSNRLDWIKDSVPSTTFTVDIDGQNVDNYEYDSIGNLIRDTQAGIDSISWNVYGKIQKINKHDGTVITYTYDASQNRLSKIVTGAASGNGETWYVHDAGRNIMSDYIVNNNSVNGGKLTLSEQNIFGSSRLGTNNPSLNLVTYAQSFVYMNRLGSVGFIDTFIRGKKIFELANQLGNVLTTISDKKAGIDNNNDGLINYYNADILSANDYYPGGMVEPGRSFTAPTSSSYRYGFNGQEKDINIQSDHYSAEYWEYDARIVRRWNLDPKPTAGISEYSVFNGNPIWRSDPLGDTSVTGAGGGQNVNIDEKSNSLQFYSSANYNVSGANTKVPVQTGQLRSFSNGLGTFTAKWSTNSSGVAVFAGYKNENNQTVDDVVREISSWKYKAVTWLTNFGNSKLGEYSVNPVAYNIKLTTTMLSIGAVGAVDPAAYVPGYNPSITLSEGATDFGFAYRAINPKFVQSTIQNGFYISGAPGRLGNNGVYVNSTIEGAAKEFFFHNPSVNPAIFEVTYPLSRPLLINPPSGYFAQPLPFTQDANILSAPSLRAPGTTNLLIRTGAEVGKKIQ